MTHLDSSEIPLIDQKIADLWSRAGNLRRQSNLFLGATILLLTVGAVFFYLAPRLTLQEIEAFGSFLQQKQDQISREEERLNSLQATFEQSRKEIADHLFADRFSISKVHPKPVRSFGDVFFLDSEIGWAMGSGGTILTTEDGGQTWTPQSSGSETLLHSVHFVGPAVGWAVGLGGTIVTTQDGGEAWTGETVARRITYGPCILSVLSLAGPWGAGCDP